MIKNIYKRKIYIGILSSELKFLTDCETDRKENKLILLNLDRRQYYNKKAQNIFDSFHSSLLLLFLKSVVTSKKWDKDN